MAVLVKTILKNRLKSLSAVELDDDVFSAYFDHKMAEHNVDQNDPEVVKAVRAYLEYVKYRSSLQDESLDKFVEGRRDLSTEVEKVALEAVFDEIIRRHDVDLKNLEVEKALRALTDVDRRMIEIQMDQIKETRKAFELYAAFKFPRSTPPK